MCGVSLDPPLQIFDWEAYSSLFLQLWEMESNSVLPFRGFWIKLLNSCPIQLIFRPMLWRDLASGRHPLFSRILSPKYYDKGGDFFLPFTSFRISLLTSHVASKYSKFQLGKNWPCFGSFSRFQSVLPAHQTIST